MAPTQATPLALAVHVRIGQAPEAHVGDLPVPPGTTARDLLGEMPALLRRFADHLDRDAGAVTPTDLIAKWEESGNRALDAAADDLRAILGMPPA